MEYLFESLFPTHLVKEKQNNECAIASKYLGKICGTIQNGKYKGSSRLVFRDGSQMQVYLKSGIIHGKTYLYDKNDALKAVGRYENGVPHGPFWIFNQYQYAQIHFKNGELGMKINLKS